MMLTVARVRTVTRSIGIEGMRNCTTAGVGGSCLGGLPGVTGIGAKRVLRTNRH